MTAAAPETRMTDTPAPAPMGSFERLLTVWVALACYVAAVLV